MAQSGGEVRHLVRGLIVAIGVGIAAYVLFLVSERLFGTFPPLQIQLIEAGLVVLLGVLVARSFTSTVRRSLVRERTARHAGAVGLFVDAIVAIAVLLALLHIFGVSLESVFLGSAFAAIVIGLASQTVLTNVFSGFMIVLGRPFVVGQRVSLVPGNYGVIWPSYPHEAMYPVYSGTVEDIELLYTVVRLDSGQQARVPSSVAFGSLIVRHEPTEPHLVRVRVTLPHAIPLARVEASLAALRPELAPPGSGLTTPTLEVADLGVASWDAVACVWTREPRPEAVRDVVLRRLLGDLALGPPAAAPRSP